MGKIGDLFVRLGLKKDDFDKGVDQSQTKLQGFGSKLKSFKAGALAIWSAVGVGLFKLADNFAHASQRFGDQWDTAMSRMKTAWGQFLTALTEWDFEGFGKRVSAAMDAAAKSQQAHDAEFEIENALKLRKAAIREELAQLQIQMRNQKLSYEERVKAAEDYLNKVKPLYDEEIKLRAKIKATDMDEYLANAGVTISGQNRQNLETFLTQVAPNDALLNALDRNSRRITGDLRVGEIYSRDDARLVEEFQKQFQGDYRTQAAFETLARYYLSSKDETAIKVVDAIEAAYAAEAAFAEETRRVQQVKNSADASSSVDTGGINTSGLKNDSEQNRAESIQRSAQDYFKSDLQLLKEKYDEEKALLEKYGLDTTALTDKYWKQHHDIIAGYLNETIDSIEEIEPVEIEPVEIDMSDVDAEIQAFLDELEDSRRRAEEAVNAFGNAVANGFADSCQVLMDSLFGLEDFNGGAVVKALLDPLADLAMSAGAIIMAEGIATLAAKSALETFGATGWGAVAAGAALIAAGAAAKAGLAALANKGSTSTAMSSNSASSSSSKTQTVESEMTIYVTGRISGSDILISGQRTAESWAR